MTQDEDKKDITLDDLLKVVEAAARTIERLQAANATLKQQMRDYEAAMQAAAEDAEIKSRQIEALQKSEAALREEAEWSRWFRNKYSQSTFIAHIERDFENRHRTQEAGADGQPPAPRSGVAPDAS